MQKAETAVPAEQWRANEEAEMVQTLKQEAGINEKSKPEPRGVNGF